MRKVFFILLLGINVFLFSCDSGVLLEQISMEKHKSQAINWQGQLDYAKSKNRIVTKVTSMDFFLRNYTYKGQIKSKKEISEIIERLFDENSVMALYKDSLNFEIVPLSVIRQKVQGLGIDDPLKNIQSQLERTIQVGMKLIELEWSFNGDIFHSVAIVSDNFGIIYDHIGHMVLEINDIRDFKRDNDDVIFDIPLLKTGNESEGSIVRSFNRSDSRSNFYGMTVWRYSINCESFFNANGILYDRKMNASRYAAIGYSCAADVRSISGELNSSNYHEFAWGYAYGAAVSVSLEWKGTGFQIFGGGTGNTGTEVHRP